MAANPNDIKALADKYKSVMHSMTERAAGLMTRLDKVETRGHAAMAAQNNEIDKMENYVQQVEEFTAQLSNGGPPLDDKSAQRETPAGVTLNPEAPQERIGPNGVVAT